MVKQDFSTIARAFRISMYVTISSCTEELFLATTPYQRTESPEFRAQGQGDRDPFDGNLMSLQEEQERLREEEQSRLSDGTLEDE